MENKVKNPKTGRFIAIGGVTYNKLINEGIFKEDKVVNDNSEIPKSNVDLWIIRKKIDKMHGHSRNAYYFLSYNDVATYILSYLDDANIDISNDTYNEYKDDSYNRKRCKFSFIKNEVPIELKLCWCNYHNINFVDYKIISNIGSLNGEPLISIWDFVDKSHGLANGWYIELRSKGDDQQDHSCDDKHIYFRSYNDFASYILDYFYDDEITIHHKYDIHKYIENIFTGKGSCYKFVKNNESLYINLYWFKYENVFNLRFKDKRI